MERRQNRRGIHRRYADRRVAALLTLYEILYHENPGPSRDTNMLAAIQEDYQIDRAALLSKEDDNKLGVIGICGNWGAISKGSVLTGVGLCAILDAHREVGGALTLSKFKRPSMIDTQAWEDLWSKDLSTPASALLSVPIEPKNAKPAFLWLALDAASREWSSHDRDLSEEIASLLGVALDKNN